MLHICPRKAIAMATCLSAVAWAVCSLQAVAATAQAKPPLAGYRTVAGGTFSTLLPPDGKQAPVSVPSFVMRVQPVTQAEFAQFVLQQPQWRRSRAAGSSLADGQYLRQWAADLAPHKSQGLQPVTDISWFAAAAYCQSEGARLPTWHEWEYAAAADEKRRDARKDPAWRARILDWYGQPSKPLPAVGHTKPNVYGIHDLHGVIWEWVDDAGALMVSGDNRTQGDPDNLQFCGAGALSSNDRENYPVLMRIAMLSSLSAASTNRNLGFRCVRERLGTTR
jgi:formylglycine-generating enzyme